MQSAQHVRERMRFCRREFCLNKPWGRLVSLALCPYYRKLKKSHTATDVRVSACARNVNIHISPILSVYVSLFFPRFFSFSIWCRPGHFRPSLAHGSVQLRILPSSRASALSV